MAQAKEKEIKIPVSVIEALLVTQGDPNVLAQIRKLAEEQAPEKWKTHKK